MHEKLPQERIDRFVYRLKKVIVECQRHQDYQAAIDFFLDKAEHYQVQAKSATQQSGGTAATVRHDGNFQNATAELRSILERFANGQSMQPIFDSVDQLYTDAKNDDGLRSWFRCSKESRKTRYFIFFFLRPRFVKVFTKICETNPGKFLLFLCVCVCVCVCVNENEQ